MKFDVEDHSITSGQPWEGVTDIKCSQAECEMTVRAGRKGSSDVANWFKDAIGQGSAIACSSIDSLPGKLNFAFVGNMEFDFGSNRYSARHCSSCSTNLPL